MGRRRRRITFQAEPGVGWYKYRPEMSLLMEGRDCVFRSRGIEKARLTLPAGGKYLVCATVDGGRDVTFWAEETR